MEIIGNYALPSASPGQDVFQAQIRLKLDPIDSVTPLSLTFRNYTRFGFAADHNLFYNINKNV